MPKIKKYKRSPVSRYGFPLKVKMVHPQKGRPKKTKEIRKIQDFNEFCLWASLPSPLREPKTQKEFAAKWGLSEPTLALWKAKPLFWETVASIRRDWARDKTSDVIHGLFKRASTRGEAAEVKLWLQVVEDWSEKQAPQTQNITVIGIQGITSEELQQLTKPAEDRIEDGETIS